MSKPLLGCIADDFTGATDLASTLVRFGMRSVQTIGVPADLRVPDADAIVIALKTRTVAPEVAVEQSLAALKWLQAAGCEQFFFKYCSTFDSTPRGNIGPVADALADVLGVDLVTACPAFPENGRTVYRGHLFVGDVLLSDSGMRHHPLTPMTDPNLVRVLQAQTTRPVGLVSLDSVSNGPVAIAEAMQALRAQGKRYAIVDAVCERDLLNIGAALAGHRLVTGGSAVSMGLPGNFIAAGKTGADVLSAADLPTVDGFSVVLSGSCSAATNAQVQYWKRSRPAFQLDALSLASGDEQIEEAIVWAAHRVPSEPVLVYGSATPDVVKQAQEKLGVEKAGAVMERALAMIGRALVEKYGVTTLVVAGGETSGAVVNGLDVTSLRIGALIDPGVPWTIGSGVRDLALALKSGNFGVENFFEKALATAPGRSNQSNLRERRER
ncbi:MULTISPECIES: 3-oxo-tetronate kinase [Paraburkholderia]|uniref:3-oxo-tetronate kinase n=1 Tax=Paraburkholderia TaxID=1822464 RepID=UPI00225319B1|nr:MULTISPECIES: 3-oxo-tetronate kinase [Paraburkholderia]MCX4163179.1 four-carbon acid sugar kinase family protein [Paraburkholderia megapolitana]MDN7158675.1 four-carbon acid sugar kinase family protein [Paraburkholderia sp. CHISQ3]MDQ6495722.1 four-carbon acid sugar kinase family protein [Paraburkholderia megapolitana]